MVKKRSKCELCNFVVRLSFDYFSFELEEFVIQFGER